MSKILGQIVITVVIAFVAATGASATPNFLGMKLLVFGMASARTLADQAP